MKFLKISVLVLVLIQLGCGQDPLKTPLDYVPHMFDSKAVKAQHLDANGLGMRTPPEGTISLSQEVYPFDTDPEGSAKPKTTQ